MARTLSSRSQDTKIIQTIQDLRQQIEEIRSNQAVKLSFVDIRLDGSGSQGVVVIGLGNNRIYFQSRAGGGIDFFRLSDNVKIMSIDVNGNVRALGSITGNTSP